MSALAVPAAGSDLILRDGQAPAAVSAASGGEVTGDGAVQSRPEVVRVDASVLAAASEGLWLELEAGQRRWAMRTGLERTGAGGLVWRGRFVEDDPEHVSVTLSLHGGLLHGSFEAPDGRYALRQRLDGWAELTRFDAVAEPACAVGAEPVLPVTLPMAEAATARAVDAAPAPVEGRPQVGILVLYSRPLAEELGGDAAAEAAARGLVDALNTAFINSAIDGRAYLAAARPWPASFAIANMTQGVNRAMNDRNIQGIRDETGADLVALLTNRIDGGCGYARVMYRYLVGPQMAPEAYSGSCYFNGLARTFIHEIGHNLGAQHDPEHGAPPDEASFPWSFGHQDFGEFGEVTFATVMSYYVGGPRLDQFSNPQISYHGQPTGIPDQRDNARTLGLTLPIVAAFRPGEPPPEPPPSPPAAPAKLTAKALGKTRVELAWRDLADNETAYAVEMKVGKGFVEIASLAADSTRLVVADLAPGKAYVFRVRATNAGGASRYSNVARAKTPK